MAANDFYGAGVSDAHSGFRVMSREALETLDCTTTGMEFASEMIMEAGAKNLTIEEVPITYHERGVRPHWRVSGMAGATSGSCSRTRRGICSRCLPWRCLQLDY